MLETTAAQVAANELKKGDVLGTARFAGIQAAKGATALMPSAGSSAVDEVVLSFEVADAHVDIESIVTAHDGARVGIQAMTAATVAALTIYDMCKSVDRTMVIEDIGLVELPRSDG